ncbi:MAG: zinc ribbon domain-containing protein [Spirochaetales bacterium]|nr:zinc ribbon domain-containing protein [Spirochaetales bacterium]
MPIYTYRCSKCGNTFDASQSFSDDPLTDCPKCRRRGSLKKVFAPAAVIFKGSGFYCTDNGHGAACNCAECRK